MNYDETVALCALNKIFGYHPRLGLNLISGNVLDLFASPQEVPGHPELAEQLTPASLEWAVRELTRIKNLGFRFLTILDDDYPSALRECDDPPLGLYLNASSSATEVFSLRPMVGFVGTRDMSPYGKAWCRKLVQGLAEAPVQPCIVSGLAFGVDGVAHQSALEFGLPTVGVMATGIEKVYPWQHEKLAMSMVLAPGSGVLTDYPLDTAPVALNFLRRNRIIAGLVRGVVVVESKTRGGSLMTARYACDYGRDVFAVPGRLDDPRSAGCNSLIHEHMAEIVTSPEALAAALSLRPATRAPGNSWALRHPKEESPNPVRVAAAPASAAPSSSSAPDGVSAGPSVSRARSGAASGLEGRSFRPQGRPVASAGTDLLQAALVRSFGGGSAAEAVGLAVREHRGILPDDLAALTHRPIAEVLDAIGQLEVHGYLTTDILRRCTLSPPWD